MNNTPTSRDYARMQPADFALNRDLQVTTDLATRPTREYRVSLTAWATAAVWVEGIDEHDAKEAAHLLWGAGFDHAFTHTNGGIDAVTVVETRKMSHTKACVPLQLTRYWPASSYRFKICL